MKTPHNTAVVMASLITATLLLLTGCSADTTSPSGEGGNKPRIYLNLSYSGNNWQDQAANLAMSVANAPGVLDTYSVEKVISGIDPQKPRPDRLARYTAAVETAPDPADSATGRKTYRKKAATEDAQPAALAEDDSADAAEPTEKTEE
jgi:hypothetical protein